MEENNKQKITIASKKDFEISYFVGPGKGGQKKQKTHSGTMIIHKESGATGRCSESRSQSENKEKAFKRLIESPKFKFWLNKKLYEIENEETIEKTVDREMKSCNIKYEVKDDSGNWIEVPEDYFKEEEAKKEI